MEGWRGEENRGEGRREKVKLPASGKGAMLFEIFSGVASKLSFLFADSVSNNPPFPSAAQSLWAETQLSSKKLRKITCMCRLK